MDVFHVTGGKIHDYQMRVNDPDRKFAIRGIRLKKRESGLYAEESRYPLKGFRTGGATTEPFSAVWGGALKVRATVLTPCDEVITYHTPAWRNPHEVFAAPGKSFDTLVLRNVGRKSRFVAVYEVFEGRTSLLDVRLDECEPDVLLHLKLRDGTKYETKIGGGGDDWSVAKR